MSYPTSRPSPSSAAGDNGNGGRPSSQQSQSQSGGQGQSPSDWTNYMSFLTPPVHTPSQSNQNHVSNGSNVAPTYNAPVQSGQVDQRAGGMSHIHRQPSGSADNYQSFAQVIAISQLSPSNISFQHPYPAASRVPQQQQQQQQQNSQQSQNQSYQQNSQSQAGPSRSPNPTINKGKSPANRNVNNDSGIESNSNVDNGLNLDPDAFSRVAQFLSNQMGGAPTFPPGGEAWSGFDANMLSNDNSGVNQLTPGSLFAPFNPIGQNEQAYGTSGNDQGGGFMNQNTWDQWSDPKDKDSNQGGMNNLGTTSYVNPNPSSNVLAQQVSQAQQQNMNRQSLVDQSGSISRARELSVSTNNARPAKQVSQLPRTSQLNSTTMPSPRPNTGNASTGFGPPSNLKRSNQFSYVPSSSTSGPSCNSASTANILSSPSQPYAPPSNTSARPPNLTCPPLTDSQTGSSRSPDLPIKPEANESRPEWILIPVNCPTGGGNTVDFAMCPHPSCIQSLHNFIKREGKNETGDIPRVELLQKRTTTKFAFTFASQAKNRSRREHEITKHRVDYQSKRQSWPFAAVDKPIRNYIKAYGVNIPGNNNLDAKSDTDYSTMVEDIRSAFDAGTAIIRYDDAGKPKNDNIPFTSAQTPSASSPTSERGKEPAAFLSPRGKRRRNAESLSDTLSGLQMDPKKSCFDIPAERFDIDALTRYWNPNFVVKRTNLTDMRSYNKPPRHFEDSLKLRPWYWIRKTDLDGLCNVHEADDADDKASVLAWLEQRHDDKAQDPFWGPMVVPGKTPAQHLGNRSAPKIQQIWENANDTSFHDYKIYQPKRGVSTTEFAGGTHVAVHRSAIQFHELVCDFRLKDAGYYTVSVFIKMPQYYVDSQTDPLPPPEHRRLWACNNPRLLRKWGYNPGLDTHLLQYPSDRTYIPKTKRTVETPIRDWLGIQILVGPPVAKESCNPQAGNIEKYRLELSRSMVSAERRITYTLDRRDMEKAMKMGLAGEWCEVPLSTKRLHVPVGNATQRILIFYGCDEIHGGYAVDRGPLIFGGARLTLAESNQDYANHGPLETAQKGKAREV